jgi:hypothetical protein
MGEALLDLAAEDDRVDDGENLWICLLEARNALRQGDRAGALRLLDHPEADPTSDPQQPWRVYRELLQVWREIIEAAGLPEEGPDVRP